MIKATLIRDLQTPAMEQLVILPNQEKQLVSNLAAQANTILVTDGFTDEVREILQGIQMLKK
ncbi:MAG: hypothetical protein ABF969_12055 [Sporolactobacillus sp.]